MAIPGITHERSQASRTLLVNPVNAQGPKGPKRNVFSSGHEIPLGLMSLSSYLRSGGYEAKILDLRTSANPLDDLRNTIDEYSPQIVGLTAFTCEIMGAAQVAETVKAIDPAILTVAGGIHASSLPQETLRQFPAFDLVVYGEGEVTLAEIVRAHQTQGDYSDIRGLAIRTGTEILLTPARSYIEKLDSLPFPDRSEVDMSRYEPGAATFNCLRTPTTGIMAGRGCPFNCYHCSKGVWGRTVRYRSAANIFSEIRECVRSHGIHDFRFFDDVLTLPQGPVRDLCAMLIDSDLNISFNCYSRIDHIDEDLLRLMKRAGCYHIKYGIEFGSERVLKLSNRCTTLDQARSAVSITKKAGILVKGNFMMGAPGESVEDCERTIIFAKEISPDLVSFGLFNLLPGSKFYKDASGDCDKSGMQQLNKDVAVGLISRAYREFYFRPQYFWQFLQHVVFNTRRWKMGLKVGVVGMWSLMDFFLRRWSGKV